ncbi:hypothetical protein [Lactiplantibacillus daowaiensis]|uniref:Uncharacterized protein n=1 Tax=Lactiplantibacillus daowaiensis TaxID=2559918 RepID=A0ABW1S176_9LACO|nr:hypothetical protein [Lactiplantibacillus daowaiensis]
MVGIIMHVLSQRAMYPIDSMLVWGALVVGGLVYLGLIIHSKTSQK